MMPTVLNKTSSHCCGMGYMQTHAYEARKRDMLHAVQ